MNRKLKVLFKQRGNVVYSISASTMIKAAVDLMNKHHIGALMVVKVDGRIEGILTERDVMKKLASTDDLVGHLEVKEIMTPFDKLITTDGEESVENIMKLMTDKNIRHIPIVSSDGNLEGILSIRDVIRILLKESKETEKNLTDYIEGTYPT